MRFAVLKDGVPVEVKTGEVVKHPTTGMQYPQGILSALDATTRTSLGVYGLISAGFPPPGRKVLSRSLVLENGTVREVLELEPQSAVPQVVSMRQARLALLAMDMLDTIEAALAALPGVEGRAAQIEWQSANEVRRDNDLINSMGAALGLTSEQIDLIFILAADIPG